jgi:Zn-dependent protease
MILWLWFVILVPSVVLHEVAHGYVAYLFGDSTAKERHRLTLNPLAHIDPFGTLLMPAVLLFLHYPAFGYAKPVPVNLSRLRKPRQQGLWVALAGPAVNIVLSGIGLLMCRASLYHAFGQLYVRDHDLFTAGEYIGIVNLVLAAFNLLPIPPLDGSAIIERFLPQRTLAHYYQFRARAMVLVFIAVLILFQFTNTGSNWLAHIENWWFDLL